MATLAEIRSQYPQYNDMSDEALASALYSKHYSDMPRDEFNKKLGLNKEEKEKPGMLFDVVNSAGSGVIKGAAAVAGLPGDLGSGMNNYVVNPIMRKMGFEPQDTKPVLGSEHIKRGIEQFAGPLYEPQTTAGEYAQTAGEFLPGAAAGPGGVARRLMMQTAIPAAASETAGQLTKGTDYEPVARIGAAVAAPLAAEAAISRFRPSIIPTTEELKAAGSEGYTKARNLGVEVKGEGIKDLAGRIRSDLEADGINAKLAGKTFSILDDLSAPPAGARADIGNLETVRRTLGRARQDFLNPTEKEAANRAIDLLDEYLANLPAKDVIAGDASQAAQVLGEARGNYSAAKRAELLDRKLEAADIRSAVANSGQNSSNAARQRVADILLQPKLKQGFSPEEIAQMERVTKGTVTGNTARRVANLLGAGGGVGQLAGAFAGGTVAGGPGAVAVPLAGMGARAIQNASTNRQLDILNEMIRSRSPLAQEIIANTPQIPLDTKNAAIIRALLASPPTQPQQ